METNEYILRYRYKVTIVKVEVIITGTNPVSAFEGYFATFPEADKQNIMDFEVVWNYNKK